MRIKISIEGSEFWGKISYILWILGRGIIDNELFKNLLFSSREAPSLELLEERFMKHAAFWASKFQDTPLSVPQGSYVGQSTCNNFTSALGAGQKVLSYTYYSPWRTVRKQYV